MTVEDTLNAKARAEELISKIDVVKLTELILSADESGDYEEGQFDIFENMAVTIGVIRTDIQKEIDSDIDYD